VIEVSKPLGRLGGLCVAAALLGCGNPAPDADADAVPIGALLPFTGSSAAGGVNHERAMLLAVEYLNAEAGRSGMRFRLAVRDSRSSVEGALGGLEALNRQAPIGLIGPNQVELVAAVRSALRGEAFAHLLPSSVTLTDFADDDSGRLIRMAPAAEYVGCALANLIYGDLHRRLVVFHSGDAYREAFATAAVSAFESFRFAAHSGAGVTLPLAAGATDAETVTSAADFEPDTAIVAADAPAAARLLRAWSTLTTRDVGWFFEPALGSEEFLRNVSPRTASGAVGVSLSLPDKAVDFEFAFAQRWGELPLVESYLYFDAVVALGLAAIQAQYESGRAPTHEDVADRVLPILRGPGRSVSWRELGQAIELTLQGTNVHYVGAAGRIFLDQNGTLDGTSAIFGFWRIRAGVIESEKFGACPAGTRLVDGVP